jgi:hypothetical protein
LNIRDRGDFTRCHLELELELCLVIARRMEGVSRAGAGHALMLLGFIGPCAGEEWEARLGRLG